MRSWHSAISRVLGKEDGALIGRCGLMDLVVESAAPEHEIRRGWFGREEAPSGVALTFETELGYTLDPAVWGQGFATEAARCVRDYARDVLRVAYTISAILPENARSRRVAERSGARATGQMHVVGLTWDRYASGLIPDAELPREPLHLLPPGPRARVAPGRRGGGDLRATPCPLGRPIEVTRDPIFLDCPALAPHPLVPSPSQGAGPDQMGRFRGAEARGIRPS